MIGRQDLKQHMNHGSVSLVEDSVIDITRFEKEVAWSVNDRLVRQDIGHVARRNLTYPWADVVVLANVPPQVPAWVR